MNEIVSIKTAWFSLMLFRSSKNLKFTLQNAPVHLSSPQRNILQAKEWSWVRWRLWKVLRIRSSFPRFLRCYSCLRCLYQVPWHHLQLWAGRRPRGHPTWRCHFGRLNQYGGVARGAAQGAELRARAVGINSFGGTQGGHCLPCEIFQTQQLLSQARNDSLTLADGRLQHLPTRSSVFGGVLRKCHDPTVVRGSHDSCLADFVSSICLLGMLCLNY